MAQIVIISLIALVIILSSTIFWVRRKFQLIQTRYAPIISLEVEMVKAQAELSQTKREQQELAGGNERQRIQLRQEYAREKATHEARVSAELENARRELVRTKQEQQEFIAANEQQRTQLTHEYEQARTTHTALQREIALLEENLEDMSFGLYKPHFDFQTSEAYKARLEALRNEARQFIRDGKAAYCPIQWTVQGSLQEGKRMAKQQTKVLLRAFNGECDAALANVSWNNITKMTERVRKAYEAINQLGTVVQVSITPEYLQLRLDELHLAYEYEEKRYQEREEQRRIREQMREEERAQREFEKALEEAEREEVRFQKALEKARTEAEHATGKQLQGLNEKILSLETQLEEARKQKERAISRAQLTKSGYVYIISNIGSFGEHVYKVGMTRRLEPLDRVYELGDASVPFPFDVHAMVYSENAPELERELHVFLNERRVNLVNPRKEFFHIELHDIEAFVGKKGLQIEFTKLAEAKEYRESLAIRQPVVTPALEHTKHFPADLFSPSTEAKGETLVTPQSEAQQWQ